MSQGRGKSRGQSLLQSLLSTLKKSQAGARITACNKLTQLSSLNVSDDEVTQKDIDVLRQAVEEITKAGTMSILIKMLSEPGDEKMDTQLAAIKLICNLTKFTNEAVAFCKHGATFGLVRLCKKAVEAEQKLHRVGPLTASKVDKTEKKTGQSGTEAKETSPQKEQKVTADTKGEHDVSENDKKAGASESAEGSGDNKEKTKKKKKKKGNNNKTGASASDEKRDASSATANAHETANGSNAAQSRPKNKSTKAAAMSESTQSTAFVQLYTARIILQLVAASQDQKVSVCLEDPSLLPTLSAMLYSPYTDVLNEAFQAIMAMVQKKNEWAKKARDCKDLILALAYALGHTTPDSDETSSVRGRILFIVNHLCSEVSDAAEEREGRQDAAWTNFATGGAIERLRDMLKPLYTPGDHLVMPKAGTIGTTNGLIPKLQLGIFMTLCRMSSRSDQGLTQKTLDAGLAGPCFAATLTKELPAQARYAALTTLVNFLAHTDPEELDRRLMPDILDCLVAIVKEKPEETKDEGNFATTLRSYSISALSLFSSSEGRADTLLKTGITTILVRLLDEITEGKSTMDEMTKLDLIRSIGSLYSRLSQFPAYVLLPYLADPAPTTDELKVLADRLQMQKEDRLRVEKELAELRAEATQSEKDKDAERERGMDPDAVKKPGQTVAAENKQQVSSTDSSSKEAETKETKSAATEGKESKKDGKENKIPETREFALPIWASLRKVLAVTQTNTEAYTMAFQAVSLLARHKSAGLNRRPKEDMQDVMQFFQQAFGSRGQGKGLGLNLGQDKGDKDRENKSAEKKGDKRKSRDKDKAEDLNLIDSDEEDARMTSPDNENDGAEKKSTAIKKDAKETDEQPKQAAGKGKPKNTQAKEGTGAGNACQVCSQPASNSCSRCKNTHYCGRDHQKSDWGRHKAECNKSS